MKKYIKIEQGSYRNKDQSGKVFPIVKDYQKFAGKPGGFVTVDVTEIDGYEGLDKVRINVENISDITIVNEQTFVKFKDEINKADPEGLSTKDESEEEAINRIQSRFEILNEMTEAVRQRRSEP